MSKKKNESQISFVDNSEHAKTPIEISLQRSEPQFHLQYTMMWKFHCNVQSHSFIFDMEISPQQSESQFHLDYTMT